MAGFKPIWAWRSPASNRPKSRTKHPHIQKRPTQLRSRHNRFRRLVLLRTAAGINRTVVLRYRVFLEQKNNEFQVASKSAEVLYAGGVAGKLAGLVQIKIRVPENAVATGNAVPFLLIVGSHWTVYDVRVAIR